MQIIQSHKGKSVKLQVVVRWLSFSKSEIENSYLTDWKK
jgi:hypothetical protein